MANSADDVAYSSRDNEERRGFSMSLSVHGTRPKIACCLCGIPTDSAVDGRCLNCLAATVDITEGISKELEIEMCETCAQGDIFRWYRNPQWVLMEPESAELLSFCVRKIRGLKAVRMVDASWIWQEPHSRRLKVKLTVQKDWQSSVVQQSFVVDYTVKTRCCDKCNKIAAHQEAWMANVQVRQRAEHPRTLLAMEQQMIKRQAELGRSPPMDVRRTKDGLDFHFARRQHAQRFVSLLHSLAPCRSKASSAVIAANSKLGTSNVRHTWSVEVAPINRGDLVRVPRSIAGGAAGGSPWAIVTAVGGSVRLLEPTTGRTFDLSSEAFWKQPLVPVASRKQLSTFVVLDVEVDDEAHSAAATSATPASVAMGSGRGGAAMHVPTGTRQADATVARERDFGANDIQHLLRTHLGGVLEAGDEALGYDLEGLTSIDEDGEADLPQAVILIGKKRPPQKSSRVTRGSGAARRRRKKGGVGGDDDSSSMCSSMSYQTDASDILDALSLADGEEDTADEEMLLGAGLGDFLGTIAHGADEDEGEEGHDRDDHDAVAG